MLVTVVVTVVDTLSLLTFAGLPECHFSVPAPESHRSVVSLSSSQTLYRSFPCKHENSLTPLFLLSPKSLTTFQGPDGLGKIISHPAGHSVVTGFRATKKAGTQMRTDFPQNDRLIPCGGGFTFM